MTSTPSTPVAGTKVNTNVQAINHPAYHLLRKAHPVTTSTAIFTDKVRNKPLLLAPSHQPGSASTTITTTTTTKLSTKAEADRKKRDQTTLAILASKDKDKRKLRRHIRQRKKQYHIQHAKPRPLSAKEKRQLQLRELSPNEIRYDIYLGLNKLWRGYLLEVLGLNINNKHDGASSVSAPQPPSSASLSNSKTKTPKISKSPAVAPKARITPSNHGSLLASLDYHGMNVQVTRSNDPGRVGLKGIVVRETKSTFVVVRPDNRAIRVMKAGTVFTVVVDIDTDADDDIGDDNDKTDIREQHQHQHPHSSDAEEDEKTKSGAGGTTGVDVDVHVDLDTNLPPSLTTTIRTPPPVPLRIRRQLTFELYGSQLDIRPVDRAIRKFKWHTQHA